MNIQKTKYMKKVPPFQIKIEDTDIDQVSDFNFLGITINKHLNWKTHVDKISHKISRNIGILNKLKHFLLLRTKILNYNSLTVSNINYGLLVWSYTRVRLFKLQKKGLELLVLVNIMLTQNQSLNNLSYLNLWIFLNYKS